ncbi:MAG: carboxypeptidase regulatory-like domain-containing protein [Gemmatimonadaceae bacterium]|nr:carboxypeptidase regulatory-like domain-containing protein [Gemmatimonadaceae bacterium]
MSLNNRMARAQFAPVMPMRRPFRNIIRRAALAAWLLASPVALFAQQAPGRPATPAGAPAPATITGTVVDEVGLPVAGARVATPDGTISGDTDASGAFRITGFPPGKTTLDVSKPGFAVLTFDFDIAAGVTVGLKLTLQSVPPPIGSDIAGDSADMVDDRDTGARTATIRGRVIDSLGRPVFGASVSEASSKTGTLTDSTGRFRLSGIEAGLAFVRVRKLGYLAEYFPVTTVAGKTATAVVQLKPAGQQLATVNVREDAFRANPRMQGYYERMKKGGAIFIDRTEIVQRNATQLSEVLRGRNGIYVYNQGPGRGSIIAGRSFAIGGSGGQPGVCPLAFILDGVNIPLTQGVTIDQLVNVQDIRAMEVYNSGPAVPGELANGATNCGAVVVWTR